MTMFSERITGTGYFIKRILKVLQQIDNHNKYTLLFSSSVKEPQEVFGIFAGNFKVKKVPLIKNKICRIAYEQFFMPLEIKNRFDVFYSPVPSVPIFLKLKGTKIISTIHDLTPFRIEGKYGFFQQKYVELITKKAPKVSESIVTVSENSKSDICNELLVDNKKVHVIYNFTEKQSLPDSKKKRNNIFFFVGNIQPGKNIQRMIEAFEAFSLVKEKYELHLLGKIGWKSDGLIKRIESSPRANNIRLLGYVSDDVLDDYYKNSAALLYPSLYEGFGIPPLEAISLGCPIVISDLSSLPEVGGEAAIYVDPYSVESIKSGMLQAIDKEVIAEKFMFYEKQIRKFDSKVQTQRLLALFEQN